MSSNANPLEEKQSFPASLDYLYPLLLFVQKFCQKQKLNEHLIDKIILATEEAAVNVIRYSYPDGKGHIELCCEYNPTEKPSLKVLIRDNGIPFNPATISSSVKEKKTGSEDYVGGYGIYIYSKIMDRVEYQRFENENLLSLIKYIET